ncbi:family 43 glycosylhydrolase [Streptomyces sp. NPDC002643]
MPDTPARPQPPVIPGFHPDPSICRVGADYYMAHSSFEYVPGVPIWHSRDLLIWELLTNALDRPTQITPHAGAANSGVHAPTLRHHDGRFWLVTTDISEVHRGHLIVSAEDPAGPWTDPVHTAGALGIDPDLCWDEAGVCHLTWASFHPPELRGIASVPVEPSTGKLLDEPRLLWPGTGLAAPEGPHLYRIDGWWYLLLAEGGTERGHAVTIARSRSLDGPWEAAPGNPILSHRSLDHPVQNTGHADLVQCPDGTWAMVHLGVRPRGQSPGFHGNGRETFLAGVDWVDGWPVVDEGRFTTPPADHSFEDAFHGPLHPRWVSPGAGPERFARPDGGGVVLARTAETAAPALLATRVLDQDWSAEVTLEPGEGSARFTVRIDDAHWYGLVVEVDTVEAVLGVGPVRGSVGRTSLRPGEPVRLRITCRTPAPERFRHAPQPDVVSLAVLRGEEEEQLGEADGRYVSTEVAGGFTGRVLAVEALSGDITLRDFRYQDHSAAAPRHP